MSIKKKLVNIHNNQLILEFEGDKTLIYSKFLEHEMRELGIPIPHGLRGVFHGKECVRLDDKEFQKAFKEVYYLTVMNSDTFKWLDEDS
jgi:hypothetical protein